MGKRGPKKGSKQNPNRIWRDREWITKHYVEMGMSAVAMAKMAGTTGKTVLEWVDRFVDLEHRPTGFYNLGKKASGSTRLKMSESQKRVQGTQENREVFRLRLLRMWADPERRRRLSQKMSGKGNHMYGKPTPHGAGRCHWIKHTKPDGTTVSLQGSFEKRFAVALDKLDIAYSPHRGMTRFSYVLDGVDHTYAPDFYVPAWDTYYEIKGYFSPKAKRAWQAVIKAYPYIQFELVQEELLGQVERWASGQT